MAYTKMKKGSKSLPTLDIYQSQISARFFLLQLSWPSEFLPVQDPARYFVNKIFEKLPSLSYTLHCKDLIPSYTVDGHLKIVPLA